MTTLQELIARRSGFSLEDLISRGQSPEEKRRKLYEGMGAIPQENVNVERGLGSLAKATVRQYPYEAANTLTALIDPGRLIEDAEEKGGAFNVLGKAMKYGTPIGLAAQVQERGSELGGRALGLGEGTNILRDATRNIAKEAEARAEETRMHGVAGGFASSATQIFDPLAFTGVGEVAHAAKGGAKAGKFLSTTMGLDPLVDIFTKAKNVPGYLSPFVRKGGKLRLANADDALEMVNAWQRSQNPEVVKAVKTASKNLAKQHPEMPAAERQAKLYQEAKRLDSHIELSEDVRKGVENKLLGVSDPPAAPPVLDPNDPLSGLKRFAKENIKDEAPKVARGKEPIKDALIREMWDGLNWAKKMVKRGADKDSLLAAARSFAIGGKKGESLLIHGAYVLDDAGEPIRLGNKEGLLPVFDDARKLLGEDYRDALSGFLLAERQLELTRRGMKVDPGKVKEAAEHIETLRKLGGDGLLEDMTRLADRVRDFGNSAILERYRALGVISEKKYLGIKAGNQKHIPFERVLDDINEAAVAGGIPRGALKELKGDLSEKVRDPINALIDRSLRMDKWYHKQNLFNQIRRSLDNAEPGSLDDVARAVDEWNPNVITTFKDGKPQYMEVGKDLKRYLDYYAPDDPETANIIWHYAKSAAKLATRVKKAAITLTPRFGGGNWLGDSIFNAPLHAKYGFTPLIDSLRGVYEMLGRTDLYKEMEMMGGGMSHLVHTHDDYVKTVMNQLEGRSSTTLERLRKAFTGEGTFKDALAIRGIKDDAVRLLKKGPIGWLEEAAQVAEGSARMGAARRAYDKTGSLREALETYSDSTLPFHEGGLANKTWNQYEAFWNVPFLDSRQLMNTFKRDPRKASAIIGATVVAPAVSNWAYHNLHADPEHRQAYRNLSEFERASAIHLWRKDDGTFQKLPRLPSLPNLIGVAIEKSLDHIFARDPRAVGEFFKATQNATPLGNFWQGNPTDTLVNALPDLAQPLGEAAANRIPFRNADLVSTYQRDLPPQEQYSDYTSPSMRSLGKATGASPAVLENTIEGYVGGVPTYLADQAGRAAGVFEEPKREPPNPFNPVSKLTSPAAAGFNTQTVRNFYEESDRLKGIKREVDHLKSKMERARSKEEGKSLHHEYRQAKEKYGRELQAYKRFEKLRSRLKKLRNDRDRVWYSGRADKEKIMDQIDTEVERAARHIMKQYAVEIKK